MKRSLLLLIALAFATVVNAQQLFTTGGGDVTFAVTTNRYTDSTAGYAESAPYMRIYNNSTNALASTTNMSRATTSWGNLTETVVINLPAGTYRIQTTPGARWVSAAQESQYVTEFVTIAVTVPETWAAFDEPQAWQDFGEWTPATSWYWEDQAPTSTSQTRTKRRWHKTGERSNLGNERNVSGYWENGTDSQTVQNTPRALNPRRVASTGGWQDFGAWTPDASTVNYGESFTQTRTKRRWVTDYYTNDRGDTYNDTSRWENGTDSQSAIGTKAIATTFSFGNLSHTFDGNAKTATVSPSPAGATYSTDLTKGPTAGTYTVTATAYGGYTGTGSATLTIAKASQFISVSPTSSTVIAGQSVTFAASGGQTGYNWSGSASGSGNPKVVSFPTAGTYTVSVQAPDGTNYNASNIATASVTVVPATGTASLSAASLDFGSVYRDALAGTPTTASRTLALSNPGNSPVTVTSLAASGKFYVSGITPPYTLNAGASATLTLTFGPSASVGSNSGTLTVTASSNTATASLTGTGLAPTINVSW